MIAKTCALVYEMVEVFSINFCSVINCLWLCAKDNGLFLIPESLYSMLH